MSAPELGETYRLISTGERFRYIGTCPGGCHYLLSSLDKPEGAAVYAAGPQTLSKHFEMTGLLGLALAVGVLVDAGRRPGEQPLVEFTAGPESFGPWWTDENLAKAFGLDWSTGGAS